MQFTIEIGPTYVASLVGLTLEAYLKVLTAKNYPNNKFII